MPTMLGSVLACLLVLAYFKVLNNKPHTRNTTAELSLGLVSALIVVAFIMLDPTIMYTKATLVMVGLLLVYTIVILLVDRLAARYNVYRT
jgi:hypothetical protein